MKKIWGIILLGIVVLSCQNGKDGTNNDLTSRKVKNNEIGKEAICPVLGNQFTITQETKAVDYKGKTYYFCCPGCDSNFISDPEKYTKEIAGKKVLYHCPMHPTYISDKPGNCPICGMKLVPIENKKEGELSQEGLNAVSKVEGLADISISGEQEQLIGIETDTVKKRNLKFTIRAAGRVGYDPELYNAITEYKQTLNENKDSKEMKELLEASKFKLYHLGLSDEQIEDMIKEDISNLIYVNEPGKPVWVYAQIYENEVALVKKGQNIEIETVALPGKKFTGVIKSIDNSLDPETRTLKVRTQLQNPEGFLKPEMYVDAVIYVDLGIKLSVPETAIMNTGIRKVVFVKTAPGKYSPRKIETGYETEEYYEVISGLKEGEEVVTSANFLIDSESKLKSAISGTGQEQHEKMKM